MKLYVGNLSYDTTEDTLRQAFAAHGEVSSVNIITDKFSGKSRGFGFVEMGSKEEAMAAMNELNGQDLDGNTLNVNEARPREERGGGGGGRGGGGGSRGGYNRGGGRRQSNW
jgi:RNA recognition motif-containing protein